MVGKKKKVVIKGVIRTLPESGGGYITTGHKVLPGVESARQGEKKQFVRPRL